MTIVYMAATEGSLPVILVLIGVVLAILVYNLKSPSSTGTSASVGGGFRIYRNNNSIITFICVAIIMYLLYQKVYPGAMNM